MNNKKNNPISHNKKKISATKGSEYIRLKSEL